MFINCYTVNLPFVILILYARYCNTYNPQHQGAYSREVGSRNLVGAQFVPLYDMISPRSRSEWNNAFPHQIDQ